MSSAEQSHTFTLTAGQLTFLQVVIERGFIEFLEYARDSKPSRDDFFQRTYVDGFMDLCKVFGVDIPEVPERQ
jgi:hypothetical protein